MVFRGCSGWNSGFHRNVLKNSMQTIVKVLYVMIAFIWDTKVDDAVSALTVNLTSNGLGTMFSVMRVISNSVFLPIAGQLATVFLVVRFCSMALDSRGQMDLWGIGKLFIRCLLCITIANRSSVIINQLATASNKIIANVLYYLSRLTSVFSGYTSSSLSSAMHIQLNQVPDSAYDNLGTLWCLVLIVFLIILIIAAFILSWVVYLVIEYRLFKICLFGAFAPAALMTLVGGPEIARVGITYIKYMIGLIFSNVLVFIGFMMVSTVWSIFFTTYSESSVSTESGAFFAILMSAFSMIAYMAFCCVIACTVDRSMQRAFGL